jgi:copper resistance protein C
MKRIVLSLLLIVPVGAAQLEAHAFLRRAKPAVGSTVQKSPGEIRIWFTEPIVAASSSIKVFDAMGKQIDKKDTDADANNQALLHVSLPFLAPGTYKVVWRVVSADSHHTTGNFTFRVIT